MLISTLKQELEYASDACKEMGGNGDFAGVMINGKLYKVKEVVISGDYVALIPEEKSLDD